MSADTGTRGAGDAMDALIAERVFGWSRVSADPRIGLRPNGRANNINDFGDFPHYSTDIASAWLVVEKMRERGLYPRVGVDDTGNPDAPTAWFCDCDPKWREDTFEMQAETAPLAICRAALKAFAASALSTEERSHG